MNENIKKIINRLSNYFDNEIEIIHELSKRDCITISAFNKPNVSASFYDEDILSFINAGATIEDVCKFISEIFNKIMQNHEDFKMTKNNLFLKCVPNDDPILKKDSIIKWPGLGASVVLCATSFDNNMIIYDNLTELTEEMLKKHNINYSNQDELYKIALENIRGSKIINTEISAIEDNALFIADYNEVIPGFYYIDNKMLDDMCEILKELKNEPQEDIYLIAITPFDVLVLSEEIINDYDEYLVHICKGFDIDNIYIPVIYKYNNVNKGLTAYKEFAKDEISNMIEYSDYDDYENDL